MDHAFNRAQALSDAAEPDDGEWPPAEPIGFIFEDLIETLVGSDGIEEGGPVCPLSDRQATAAIWIDGHECSLTLNRED